MEILHFATFMLTLHLAYGAKFLLLPYPFASHVFQQVTIGQELARKGHEVHMVLSESFPEKFKFEGRGITIHGHHTPEKDLYMMETDDYMDVFEQSIGREVFPELRAKNVVDDIPSRNLLSDEKLYNKLRSLKFDMAILDSFPFSRCFVILLYRLGIPFVCQTTVYEPWLLRNPSLPSYVPINLLPPTTAKMSFLERLRALYLQLDWVVSPRAGYLDDNLVAKYAPEMPYTTLNNLVGKSLLWLIETDMILDYPRPVMPNEVLVGGAWLKPGKPLPGELEEFMSSNPLGVVVVSFGSTGINLPQHIMDKLLATFKRLKYSVIWRYPIDPPDNLPKHIKLMTWLPQNDLLAHNNTKLFITHCGNGGQYESLYHAVPMIGMPIFGDQPYNSKRIVYKGFGEELNIKTFTEDELESTIHKVMANPSYKEAISSASVAYRSQPMTALQRAVWWIEHVLNNGGHHYRAYALDMPWYQYLMLDIFVFVLAVFTIVTALFCFCVSKLFRTNISGKQKLN